MPGDKHNVNTNFYPLGSDERVHLTAFGVTAGQLGHVSFRLSQRTASTLLLSGVPTRVLVPGFPL